MHRIIVGSVFIYLLGITGCSHVVDPIIPKLKDPRTYKWTIDTVYYTPGPQSSGQTIITSIWGMSDTLVYAVGHDMWNGHGAIWKFHDNRWERIILLASEGGPLPTGFLLSTIKGFAENDIYAFGAVYSSWVGGGGWVAMIIHFDGKQWTEIEVPKGGGQIIYAAAVSPSRIYCGGMRGELFTYDGLNWTLDTLINNVYPQLPIIVNTVGVSKDNSVYIQPFLHNSKSGADYYEFLKYKDRGTTLIDSALNIPPWGGRWFWQSNEGTIFSCGVGGIYRFIENKWQNIYSADLVRRVTGSREDHMFAVGGDGTVYFHDGNGWSSIYMNINLPKNVYGIWCSDNQVFITFYDAGKSFILHGR